MLADCDLNSRAVKSVTIQLEVTIEKERHAISVLGA